MGLAGTALYAFAIFLTSLQVAADTTGSLPSLWKCADPTLQHQLDKTLVQLGLDKAARDKRLGIALVDLTRIDKPRMAQKWAQSDDVVMDNPLAASSGDGARSSPCTRDSSKVLPKSASSTTITPCTRPWSCSTQWAGNVVIFASGTVDFALAIRTSRLLRKIDGRWKQVHHHGSVEAPQLLAQYQEAVQGQESQRGAEP